MKRLIAILGLLLTLPLLSVAQTQTQTIRGTILDMDTRQPLEGVTVRIQGLALGANTNAEGEYRINNVPLGRHVVLANYVTYQNYTSNDFVLNSVREHVLDIMMQPATLEAVQIVAQGVNNNDPTIRSMDPQKATKQAGALADPGRYLIDEPGVSGPQDSNSDIVIRGNSPSGVLWRLEGIDIPNPNHFARKGSTGGGITVFSAQVLGESNFTTGAFQSDYGNAISGVMDMKFRRGNNEAFENRFKFGLLGTNFASEGPLGGSGASYLLNYRYSTLGILNQLGFNILDERISNTFQDLSFNLYFPTKKGSFTLFGVGGLSSEVWGVDLDSLQQPDTDFRTETDFPTKMGAVGFTYTRELNDQSYLKWVLAGVGSSVRDDDDTLNVSTLMGSPPFVDEDLAGLPRVALDRETYNDARISTHLFYNNKLTKALNLRVGALASHIMYNFQEELLNFQTNKLEPSISGEGSSQLYQGYTRFRYSPIGSGLTLNLGLHAMYFALNQTSSLEPRFSASYLFSNSRNEARDRVSFSYGLHSQILPIGNYFTTTESLELFNMDLDLLKAHHFVLGFDHAFNASLSLKIEAYYQSLFNLPVENDPASSFMFLNVREGYARRDLVSEGKGRNYGIDMGLQKSFTNGFFFMLSASVFQAQYMTLYPDRWFNSKYNSLYNTNLALGQEWNFGNGNNLQISGRTILNGGLRKSPIDKEASAAAGYFVPIHEEAWEEFVGTYFRIDLRAAYSINAKKVNHLISLDVQNVTNQQNPREPRYNRVTNSLVGWNQTGLLPVLAYQLDF